MNIKILGTGCQNCQKLEANTKQALKELTIDARVEKVTDIQEIMKYGIMSMPAVVADGKILSYGIVPGVKDIKKLLLDNNQSENKSSIGCSCSSCSYEK
jgi:small redox-active disulfide protein 2